MNAKSNLSGARYAVYDVINTTPGKRLSHNQILMQTGYRRRGTILQAINWLVDNRFIRRHGTGNGVPYSYTPVRGHNVLDS